MPALFRATILAAGLMSSFLTFTGKAQVQAGTASTAPASPQALQALVDQAAAKTLEQFAAKKLGSNELAITLIDLRDASHPVKASYRGDEPIYPASVIKLFYLAAVHRQLEDGKIKDTAELRRAMRDMIVDS